MPVPIPSDETRTPEQLRQQFEVEQELAGRLMAAPREARRRLYGEVYDEFLRRVPHQPLAGQKADPQAQANLVALQAALLEPFLSPEAVFLEVGSGDSSLALNLAGRVRQVYAVEASEEITRGLELPPNFRLVLADAPPFDLPAGSVDLAFSCHFIEHVHPEDALAHAEEMRRLLVPGGRYVCVTPNRLLGPHDISKYFADEARGLHLQEYSFGDLAHLLRRAGFRHVEALSGIGRTPSTRPLPLIRGAETLLRVLPLPLRRRWLSALGRPEPFRPLEQVILAARA